MADRADKPKSSDRPPMINKGNKTSINQFHEVVMTWKYSFIKMIETPFLPRNVYKATVGFRLLLLVLKTAFVRPLRSTP